jgi:hypothetical protein
MFFSFLEFLYFVIRKRSQAARNDNQASDSSNWRKSRKIDQASAN